MGSHKNKKSRKHQKAVVKDQKGNDIRKGKDIPKEIQNLQSDKQNQQTQKSLIEGARQLIKGMLNNGINIFSNQRYSSQEKTESRIRVSRQKIQKKDKPNQLVISPVKFYRVTQLASAQQNTQNTNEVSGGSMSPVSANSVDLKHEDLSQPSGKTKNPQVPVSFSQELSSKPQKGVSSSQQLGSRHDSPNNNAEGSGSQNFQVLARIMSFFQQQSFRFNDSSSSICRLIDAIDPSKIWELLKNCWKNKNINGILRHGQNSPIPNTQSANSNLPIINELKTLQTAFLKQINKLHSLFLSKEQNDHQKHTQITEYIKKIDNKSNKIEEIATLSNQIILVKSKQEYMSQQISDQAQIIHQLQKTDQANILRQKTDQANNLQKKTDQANNFEKIAKQKKQGFEIINQAIQQLKTEQTTNHNQLASIIKSQSTEIKNSIQQEILPTIVNQLNDWQRKFQQQTLQKFNDFNQILSNQDSVYCVLLDEKMKQIKEIRQHLQTLSENISEFQGTVSQVAQQNNQSLKQLKHLLQQTKDDGIALHQLVFSLNTTSVETLQQLQNSLSQKVKHCLQKQIDPYFKIQTQFNHSLTQQNNQILLSIDSRISSVNQNVNAINRHIPQSLSQINSNFIKQNDLVAQTLYQIKNQNISQPFNQAIQDFSLQKNSINQILTHLQSKKLSDMLSPLHHSFTQQKTVIDRIESKIIEQNLQERFNQINQSLTNRQNSVIDLAVSHINNLVNQKFNIYTNLVNPILNNFNQELSLLKSELIIAQNSQQLHQIELKNQKLQNKARLQDEKLQSKSSSPRITIKNYTKQPQSVHIVYQYHQRSYEQQTDDWLNNLEAIQAEEKTIQPKEKQKLLTHKGISKETEHQQNFSLNDQPYSSNQSFMKNLQPDISSIKIKASEIQQNNLKDLADKIFRLQKYIKNDLETNLVTRFQKMIFDKGIPRADDSNWQTFQKSQKGLLKNLILCGYERSFKRSGRLRKCSENFASKSSRQKYEDESQRQITEFSTEINKLSEDQFRYHSGRPSQVDDSGLNSQIDKNYRNDQIKFFNKENSQKSMEMKLDLDQNYITVENELSVMQNSRMTSADHIQSNQKDDSRLGPKTGPDYLNYNFRNENDVLSESLVVDNEFGNVQVKQNQEQLVQFVGLIQEGYEYEHTEEDYKNRANHK